MTDSKYRAYKPVTMTDGIRTWVQNTFDNTVPWTPADEERFKKSVYGATPNARIVAMQAQLNLLQNVTPAIKLHADAIHAIHAGLSSHFSITSWAEHEAMDKADDLWSKILILRDVMPLARKGEKFQPGKDAGAVSPLTKAIAKHLKKYPNATAAEVWKALSEKPPRGHMFMENPRFGKYIERGTEDGLKETKYARFMNIVSQEKRKLSA